MCIPFIQAMYINTISTKQNLVTMFNHVFIRVSINNKLINITQVLINRKLILY